MSPPRPLDPPAGGTAPTTTIPPDGSNGFGARCGYDLAVPLYGTAGGQGGNCQGTYHRAQLALLPGDPVIDPLLYLTLGGGSFYLPSFADDIGTTDDDQTGTVIRAGAGVGRTTAKRYVGAPWLVTTGESSAFVQGEYYSLRTPNGESTTYGSLAAGRRVGAGVFFARAADQPAEHLLGVSAHLSIDSHIPLGRNRESLPHAGRSLHGLFLLEYIYRPTPRVGIDKSVQQNTTWVQSVKTAQHALGLLQTALEFESTKLPTAKAANYYNTHVAQQPTPDIPEVHDVAAPLAFAKALASADILLDYAQSTEVGWQAGYLAIIGADAVMALSQAIRVCVDTAEDGTPQRCAGAEAHLATGINGLRRMADLLLDTHNTKWTRETRFYALSALAGGLALAGIALGNSPAGRTLWETQSSIAADLFTVPVLHPEGVPVQRRLGLGVGGIRWTPDGWGSRGAFTQQTCLQLSGWNVAACLDLTIVAAQLSVDNGSDRVNDTHLAGSQQPVSVVVGGGPEWTWKVHPHVVLRLRPSLQFISDYSGLASDMGVGVGVGADLTFPFSATGEHGSLGVTQRVSAALMRDSGFNVEWIPFLMLDLPLF